MKKNFVKKLALGLALVMAVTSVPASSEAAATPGFKSSAVKVRVGQTKKYSTENSKKYSVKFKIGNKSVATIKYSAGSKAVKVTGVAEGKTTLRADFKSYKTKEVTTARIPVTVKAVVKETAIQSVTQDTITKLTANFVGDTSAVKASDITVVRTDDNAVVAIKSVTVDGAKVVIETYTTMADGENYTVTYNSKSSVTFKATDATVSNVNVTPLVVTAAQATKVEVQTLDAAGVVLGNYTTADAGNNNLEFTLETNDGYVDGDKLYLTEVGKTAKAKVVYHTWKYDDNGNEIGKVEREFVITAVKDATVISNFNYTISKDIPAWESTSFKANTSISASDTDMRVFFNIKDSKDEQVDYTAYKVASSDTSKLIIDEINLTSAEEGVKLVGVSAGTAYILLQNANGNTVKTFPVTVLANRKASVLTLDTSAVVVSNATAARDEKEIGIAVKDQYGVKMAFKDAELKDVEPTFEVLSAPKGVNKESVAKPTFETVSDTDGKLTVSGANYTVKGTYVFKVNVAMGDVVVSRTLTVNVQQPKSEDAASYALVIKGLDANNKVDLAVKANAITAAAIKLDFAVATKDASGVLNGYVKDEVKYTVKHSSGTELKATDDSVTLTAVSGSAVIVNPKEVKTGTYTVTAKFDVAVNGKLVTKKMTKTFTVEDTQVAPTIIIKDTDANNLTIKEALAPSETVIYYYDGVKYDGQNDDIRVIEVTEKSVGAGKVFVQYVTIKFPVNDNVSRVITIPVNKTFTNVTADAK